MKLWHNKQLALLLQLCLMAAQIFPTTAQVNTAASPTSNSTVLSSLMPTTLQASATSSPSRPVGSRCEWLLDHYDGEKGLNYFKRGCSYAGFTCVGYVCVDTRTPAQIEADKHISADGQDGRCLWSSDTGTYSCRSGFECDEQLQCVDKRRPGAVIRGYTCRAAECRKEEDRNARWSYFWDSGGGRNLGVICNMLLRS